MAKHPSLKISSVSELIDLWSSPAEMAADLGMIDPTIVRMWKYRQRIPATYDLKIVEAAKRRKFPVTLLLLAELRALEGAAA